MSVYRAIARRCRLVAGLASSVLAFGLAGAHAAPTAAAGYSLSVFAGPLAGSSAPDSIAVVGRDVFVGYGNGGAPDGSGGAVSTIAEYGQNGALIGTVTVTGHNDGLRYNATTGQLWSLQNEDGNPNLVLINPNTLAASSPLSFSATPHGGGYDDIAFGPNGTYISASNPANNPNTAPAIVSVSLTPSQVAVTGSVLAGNATANVINPGGGSTTLNLQDPDSMIFAPDGRLVLDSQADQQLVFISNVGNAMQTASVLNLPTTVDDTVFASGGLQRLLFSDRGSGTIYALTGVFGNGQAVSAADSANLIAALNLSNGDMTALVSGLDSPHGEAFAAVPEPSSWAMMLIGFAGLGLAVRRRRHAVGAAG
jgi:hypothetical protein